MRAIIRDMKAWMLATICSVLAAGQELRVGIVGTDTSHATAFTALLNDANTPGHVPGARVVAAYKGGSADIPESRDRVEKYAEELRTKWKVEIVPDIPTLLQKVDAVLLESVDGRTHLRQFREIARGGKPVFIDKPLASTLEEAREIALVARQLKVRWFTSSALRFSEGLPELRIAGLSGVVAWGPGPLEAHHLVDMAWYGIHTVETLYSLMGPGCAEVTRVSTPDADVITGKWRDGRIGVVRLNRPYSAFGATVFSRDKIVTSPKDLYTGYRGLVAEIVKFLKGGPPPVNEQETLEMFAFMEAAQRSKRAGGAVKRVQ
jgi:hypothetical protein